MTAAANEYMRGYHARRTPEQKAALADQQKLYRLLNPDRVWSAGLLRMYGITGEGWYALLKEQDGKCAICRKDIQRTTARGQGPNDAHVDHCHTSGKVRGLLCSPCNRGLGLFADSTTALREAANYLEK